MELNDYYTNNAADWLKKSIKSLISHNRYDKKGFYVRLTKFQIVD